MNREQLAHIVRAAAQVVGLDDVVVLGSQAVLATIDDFDLPLEVTRSVEADITVDAALARAEVGVSSEALALKIEGSLGEGSQFHATFGYYAEGVELEVAVLPDGWRDRLVPLISESPSGPKVGWCLSIPDVWISKASAGRAKDLEYCQALATAGLVDEQAIRALAGSIVPPHSVSLSRFLARCFR